MACGIDLYDTVRGFHCRGFACKCCVWVSVTLCAVSLCCVPVCCVPVCCVLCMLCPGVCRCSRAGLPVAPRPRLGRVQHRIAAVRRRLPPAAVPVPPHMGTHQRLHTRSRGHGALGGQQQGVGGVGGGGVFCRKGEGVWVCFVKRRGGVWVASSKVGGVGGWVCGGGGGRGGNV